LQNQKRIYRPRSCSLSRLPRAYKSHRWNDQSSLGAAPLVPVLVNLLVICHVEGAELLRGVFDLASSRGPFGPRCAPVHLPKTYPPESRATYAPRRGWQNPILLFARLDAAKLHDCTCNVKISPPSVSCKCKMQNFLVSGKKIFICRPKYVYNASYE